MMFSQISIPYIITVFSHGRAMRNGKSLRLISGQIRIKYYDREPILQTPRYLWHHTSQFKAIIETHLSTPYTKTNIKKLNIAYPALTSPVPYIMTRLFLTL